MEIFKITFVVLLVCAVLATKVHSCGVYDDPDCNEVCGQHSCSQGAIHAAACKRLCGEGSGGLGTGGHCERCGWQWCCEPCYCVDGNISSVCRCPASPFSRRRGCGYCPPPCYCVDGNISSICKCPRGKK